ncbi:MAG: methionyl-tRNA formyltransferase [Anaerolineales bacterium]
MTSPRILLMGMRCEFSRIPLETLLTAGFNVIGLIIPSYSSVTQWLAPPALPMLPLDVVGLAHALKVPVLEVGRLRDTEALAALDALAPELICVACFPKLLPREWLDRPSLGALNLHPSLLPAYRGPEPLFWQFRNGETTTGLTLHMMDKGADTGDIITQIETPFPDGITYAEAERLTSQAGAQLLINALSRELFPRTPQSKTHVSYAPFPTVADRRLDPQWAARRAFNFVRGAGPWAPFELQIADVRLQIENAVNYEIGRRLPAPLQRDGAALVVQFPDGVVRFETHGGKAG